MRLHKNKEAAMSHGAKELSERLRSFGNEVIQCVENPIDYVIFQSAKDHFKSMRAAVDV